MWSTDLSHFASIQPAYSQYDKRPKLHVTLTCSDVNFNNLTFIFIVQQEGTGVWLSLDAEQVMENGLVVGTRNPTGDHILLDYRFEMPYGNDGPNALNFYLIFFWFISAGAQSIRIGRGLLTFLNPFQLVHFLPAPSLH